MRFTVLKKNNEFTRAYTKGKAIVHPLVVIYINKNRFGITRIGITASKKIGNAVIRNRARRVIRAAICDVLPQNAGAYDFVFVARGQTAKAKSWQAANAIKKLLINAGILKDE